MGKYLDEAGLAILWAKIKSLKHVEEVDSFGDLGTGAFGIIYMTKDTNKLYRWTGSGYVEVSASVALGETSTDAYPGDKGKDTADKVAAIYKGNLPLVTPVITGGWGFFKADGTTDAGSLGADANNPVIERGYKAVFRGTYKWTAAEGYKNPTSVVNGPEAWKKLPASGVDSASYELEPMATANTTVQVTLAAAKTGLMVDGTSVQPAAGNDTTTAKRTVTFQSRCFWGAVAAKAPTAAQVQALGGNSLRANRSLTVTGVTASGSQYYCYAYPKDLGDLSQIIQDGATPVLTAFTKTEVTVTNGAGVDIVYNVYTSNNPGAFTNAKLAFS